MRIRNVRTETVLVLERVPAVGALNPGPHGVVRDKVLPHVAGVRRHFPAQQATALALADPGEILL